MQIRLRIFSIVIVGAYILLVFRLFYWQIYMGRQLSVEARGQRVFGYTVSAGRGDLLASDGSWLVTTGEAWLIFASLPEIEDDYRHIADRIVPYYMDESTEKSELLVEIDRVVELLSRKDVVWVPIKHRVGSEIKSRIEDLEISGIGFEQEDVRSYPEGSSSAHLLGFVGKNEEGDDQGYFGLEGYYDLSLSGKPGFLSRESDASGVPILINRSKEVSAIEGVDLVTHIDKAVQMLVEEKLRLGIEKYGAKAGTVIVMDPVDGGIVAMSSYPSYDPREYWMYGDEFFKNPAVSSSFEPGSIFKVLIMASAIDAGVVEPETKCDICSGPFKIDKYSIETWDNNYNPDSTMTEVIVNSDNVGMVFASQKLGIEKTYKYLSEFGIGSVTNIDLQGEASPKMRDINEWSKVDLATVSFGQGIATTPIQMIRAVGAIANEGIITTPQVVDKIKGKDWEEDINPIEGKRVVSSKTASEITAMMVEAAENGEAKWTYTRGYKVAGKTGTAQIPIAGHYDEEKTIASFVGFAPFDDPEFIMLVTLLEPSSSPWASETAAPLWYSIANDLFLYFGIQPEN